MAASALLLRPTTPSSYHRIVSPTLQVPTDPTISIPVGILACQRDPYLRELTTNVVTSTIHQELNQPAKKGKKPSAPVPTNRPVLEVILHDTVIFPEGGGQPSDIGMMRTLDGTEWNIIQVKRHGGHAVHYVQINSTEDLLHFAPGVQVIVALGNDGFSRRYDHMSMHTSQHLLSALLETRLDLLTLSWSLTTYPTPCYVEIPRGMSAEEIASIQEEANRLVFEGREVHVEVDELDREQEPGVVKLGSGRSVGKALPSDYTGGVKRVVVIDGVDRNPCCGTHLPTLHNLQLFLLPHTESLSRSATTSARLYFLAGPRLINHLSFSHSHLTNVASILSCGAPQAPDRIVQVIDDRKRGDKRVEDLEGELAGWIAQDLIKQARTEADGHKIYSKFLHRIDDSPTALAFLSSISSTFVSLWPATRQYIVVLASSPSSLNASSTSLVLIVGSDEKKVKEVGDGLKAKLGIKGGGKGNKWSGKFTGVWKDGREGVMIQEAVENAAKE